MPKNDQRNHDINPGFLRFPEKKFNRDPVFRKKFSIRPVPPAEIFCSVETHMNRQGSHPFMPVSHEKRIIRK